MELCNGKASAALARLSGQDHATQKALRVAEGLDLR